MPAGDSTTTADGPRSDKPDDKLLAQDEDLELVTKAWPTLPEAIRQAIVAMVKSLDKRGEQ